MGQGDVYDEEVGEWIGLRSCAECGGEGCTDCENTGVIYP